MESVYNKKKAITSEGSTRNYMFHIYLYSMELTQAARPHHCPQWEEHIAVCSYAWIQSGVDSAEPYYCPLGSKDDKQ